MCDSDIDECSCVEGRKATCTRVYEEFKTVVGCTVYTSECCCERTCCVRLMWLLIIYLRLS